ncbi:hypothetical protein [Gordonia sp. FQ]|uniref:hypothetical protein n=1 Tax=Gordonia sp. FQ TaxID=3446634 RepID=UPI003F83396F
MLTSSVLRSCLAAGAALAVGLGGAAAAGPAAAAKNPSVRVCATLAGAPYHGPLTLLSDDWWDVFGRVQQTAGNGCTEFRNVQARKGYRVVVRYENMPCQQGLRPDGTWYRWGIRGERVGVSRHAVTKASGRTDLGRMVVHQQYSQCF